MKHSLRPVALAAALLAAGFGEIAQAQDGTRETPILREALGREVWITQPTLSGLPPVSLRRARRALEADTTPPTAPGQLVAVSSGLFLISASWSPAQDLESEIEGYAVAVGTGTTPETEANVRSWQPNGPATKVKVNLALTQGATFYISVRACNGAGLSGPAAHSSPLTAMPRIYGQPGNHIGYTFASTGYADDGKETSTWPPEKVTELSAFLDRMLPVLEDLYGPPSTAYTVTVVRDLRCVASSVFYPSVDEIHLGDTVTYQLLTHELVHAFRRDQLLSSGPAWQYDSTLSGFEEGFAQAVSYEAMTEFARRNPAFGLSQQIYQSSHEWDYDFQNVPELRTRDLWSDSGGMLLYWIRYEMAAAAIAKIEWEHPGFHRAFNTEFYRRLNDDPHVTASRDLIVDIVRTVAPVIEGRPAAQWIDEQNIFDCADHAGKKVWLLTQHYPSSGDYFIFNRTFLYETFSNGSDWEHANGTGGCAYYDLNGSTGTATLHTTRGDVVWQKGLLIAPVDNPPAFFGFGNDQVNLTTQATNLPWPGGDPTTYATNLLPFDLYRLSVQFTSGTTVINDSYRIIGAPLRNAAGVFGGVVGANGGVISLNHRGRPPGPPVPVANSVFWVSPPWASVSHPEMQSVDTDPGIVDVTYVDAAGHTYTDERVIGYGSSYGTQAFLFDVSRMTASAPLEAASIVTNPSSLTAVVGQNVQFTVAAKGTPAPAYQWQVSTNAGSSWSSPTDGAPYGGVHTAALALANVTASLDGFRFRAVATNAAGSAASASATLAVAAVGQLGTSFHTLAPCRLFDTRVSAGPDAAAPALQMAASRLFSHGGRCGIPMSATSLSVNATVTEPAAAGFLIAYPGDVAVPVASTISFRAGQTRANSAFFKLSGDGSGTVGIFNDAPGPVHVIVDVNGYFQ